jgi:hypothetical protein
MSPELDECLEDAFLLYGIDEELVPHYAEAFRAENPEGHGNITEFVQHELHLDAEEFIDCVNTIHLINQKEVEAGEG